MQKKWIAMVCGILFILGGIYIAIMGVQNYTVQLKQESWPLGQALIEEVEQYKKRTGSHATVYDIVYSYTVEGQTYYGQIIGTTRRREVGGVIEIRYDPTAPEVSTHIIQPQFWGTLLFNFGGALLFGCVGMYIAGWLRIKKKKRSKAKAAGLAFPVKVSIVLISISLAAGIWMLVQGIRGVLPARCAAYEKVSGYLMETEPYIAADGDTLYRLVYHYEVNGKTYKIATDYGTKRIPAGAEEREVHYDPANPGKAVLRNLSRGLVYGGILFTGVPVVMILGSLAVCSRRKGGKIDWMDLIVGGVTAAISLGMCYAISGKASPIAAFGRMGIFGVIPLLLLLAAGWLILRGLFFKGRVPRYRKDI